MCKISSCKFEIILHSKGSFNTIKNEVILKMESIKPMNCLNFSTLTRIKNGIWQFKKKGNTINTCNPTCKKNANGMTPQVLYIVGIKTESHK